MELLPNMNEHNISLEQYRKIKCRHLNLPESAYSTHSKYIPDRPLVGFNKNTMCRLKNIEKPDCHNCDYWR